MDKRYELFGEELDKLFGNFFGKKNSLVIKGQEFKENIKETESELIARLELPGFSEEDINISVKGNLLECKVQKVQEVRQEDKKTGTYNYSSSSSSFYRSIQLPENADTDNLTKNYQDGVLEIRVPKKK